MDRQEGGQIYG
ncbi:hypothetical protein BIW11_04962 [Tropilaelaps mercedesae]|uniref:Uncharacterized protein n=1 Tax=Tropilaelaps mercedesae TaxID=418985 RepID=A0A1V9WZU4_9ACAR|nr:hypothetical protein BIW11_04962 [Tropilaelaps mercedesae]